MKHLVFSLILVIVPTVVAACPNPPDHQSRLADLTYQLSRSPNPVAAQPLTQEIWTLWLDAPDALAQQLLDQGMFQREAMDFAAARATLDQLVQYCPTYAEGYNQRAFVSYLAQDFEAALVDLNRAIELVPNHIAALSGKGLTLMGLGRNAEADAAFRAALALNPWLAERRFLNQLPGTDI